MCEYNRDSWFYFIKSGKVNQFRIKRIVILQRTCRKYHRICRVTICREKGMFSIIEIQNKGGVAIKYMYNTIRPGQVWLDTDGKRIQAHGGSLIYDSGKFYWYGENKEKTTGQNALWHWGVRCYSSEDLYNWKDEWKVEDYE